MTPIELICRARAAHLSLPALMVAALLTACGGSGVEQAPDNPPVTTPDPTTPTDPDEPDDPVTPEPDDPVSFLITPGPDATQKATEAVVSAKPGDVIEFDCGFFEINKTLLISNVENITIRGCGINDTVLSFRGSDGIEGFLVDNVRGITFEDLTVADSDGNGFELRSVDHGTLRRVRAFWSSNGGAQSPDPITADNMADGRLGVACTDPATQDPSSPDNSGGDTTSPDYTVSDKAGRYGIYPVKSQNILVEFSESIGASDAGIYVGQTNNAIIRNSRAAYNVFGFEIENVQGGEYEGNLAECNTGGFLIYDLDKITQYGDRSRMYNNVSRNNNTYNFTEGGFVSNVPPGSGMITLSYDRIDVFDNLFENNNTGGIIHVSYELFPEGAGRPDDRKIDFYTEGVHIYRNTFRNNGNNLPEPTANDAQNQDVARFLPAVVGMKTQAACNDPQNAGKCPTDETGGFRGAHIVWDGLLEEYDADCPYPVDSNGEPLPMNELGKPEYTNEHPEPDCRYNAYKFDLSEPANPVRKKPQWFASCIDDSNVFSDDSVVFSNFRGLKGVNAALAVEAGNAPTPEQIQELEEFPAVLELTEHQCPEQYGSNLPALPPVVIPEFVPSPAGTARTEEEIAALCNATLSPGTVNFDAAVVDCPDLANYNLFENPEDPTSMPNSGGFPYALNTKLFSDYSVKYRVAYLPPGTQAVYQSSSAGSENAAVQFPVGTIIAKTFSFLDGDTETAIETRLMIKRDGGETADKPRWRGLPYVWETAEDGSRRAVLNLFGETKSVSWDYQDPETLKSYAGSTAAYSVPNANQCLSCHTNEDVDNGSAPIGPKLRNLNRPYASESSVTTGQSGHPIAGINQIAWLCNNGLMAGCPDDLAVDPTTQYATADGLTRSPKFNVPGDGDHPAGTNADIEQRARAWLEVNCQHCHNNRGFAANTGFYTDVFRTVDTSYGICKGPTASGAEGSGGRAVDIHPGRADLSILPYRLGPEADTASARMPPIARSVVDQEAFELVTAWIDNVIVADNMKYPGSESCAGDGGGNGAPSFP